MCKEINVIKNTRKFCLIVFFFTVFNSILANVDYESWSSLEFRKKLPFSFELDFEQSLRLKDNLSSFKQTFTETSISYSMFNGMKFFIPFRYAVFKDKIKKRISFGAAYKHNLNKISFRYRIKLQKTYLDDKIFNPLIRNKFTLGSKINKKLRPYVSQEFSHFAQDGQFDYDEYRLSVGVRINLGKKRETKIFYTQKIEGLSKKNQDKANVLGLSYAFEW